MWVKGNKAIKAHLLKKTKITSLAVSCHNMLTYIYDVLFYVMGKIKPSIILTCSSSVLQSLSLFSSVHDVPRNTKALG